MGRKLGYSVPFWGGGAGSPSNTMWPGPETYLHAKFHLDSSNGLVIIHQRHRQTDRQDRTNRKTTDDSIGRTVFSERELTFTFAICYRPSVCRLSVCLPLTLVYCGQTIGWIKMKLGMQIGLGPGHIALDGDPAPPPQRDTAPNFRPISVVAKWLNGLRCHFAGR